MFKQIAILGTLASVSAVGVMAARREFRSWGVDPFASAERLAGDELVAAPTTTDTRSIEIAAPPEQVWPWLVQMGYKRAGWYSYDAIDMNQGSSREIVPEYQAIEVGQVMPTHPEGGFIVKVVEPDRALVLYLDSTIARDQAAEHRPSVDGEGPVRAEPDANIRATGRFLNSAVPGEFAASWAFVLEPTETGGTRLIERFRVALEAPTKVSSSVFGPILGFGVFAMTRRQMLGIRERATAVLRPANPAMDQPMTV